MGYRELGQSFAELRREQGASQQQVADGVGIFCATINAFETGRAGDVGLKKVLRMTAKNDTCWSFEQFVGQARRATETNLTAPLQAA